MHVEVEVVEIKEESGRRWAAVPMAPSSARSDSGGGIWSWGFGFQGSPWQVGLEGANGGGRLSGEWAGNMEHSVGKSQHGDEKVVVSIL